MMMRICSEYKGFFDFFMVPVPCPGGGERRVKLGFGPSGSMWIDPRELGIGPQHAMQLQRFGESYLMVNAATGEVMINARAVVLVKTDREWGRKWLSFVECKVKEHKAVRARFEGTRNNWGRNFH